MNSRKLTKVIRQLQEKMTALDEWRVVLNVAPGHTPRISRRKLSWAETHSAVVMTKWDNPKEVVRQLVIRASP